MIPRTKSKTTAPGVWMRLMHSENDRSQVLRQNKSENVHGSARGFTMVELMVAMVVAGIVLTGIFSFAAVQKNLASDHQQDLRTEQGLDGAMWAMSRDINMAGLGIVRTCTELRIWDAQRERLLNPGAIQDPTKLVGTAVDPLTQEPYWVLRDGIQAHWRSDTASSLFGATGHSSELASAADSLDVMLGEGNFATATGLFRVDISPWLSGDLKSSSDAYLTLRSFSGSSPAVSKGAPSAALYSDTPEHIASAQQLFRPGSFVIVNAIPYEDAAFRPARQSQCALLQVTGNLVPGDTADEWRLPVSNTSGFNKSLENVLGLAGATEMYAQKKASDGGTGDWHPDSLTLSTIIPLGNFRWSRYEVDYTVKRLPYLVRVDLVGWRRGDTTFATDGIDYPGCESGRCPAPSLRIPGYSDLESPPREAVAPMVEDLQVAIGCDGYTQASVDAMLVELEDASHPRMIPGPDLGFEEVGDEAMGPNLIVDEYPTFGSRGKDEWVGNAMREEWAPDCVFYGTGEAYKDSWPAVIKTEALPGPAFRMSPQVLRVTLVARREGRSGMSVASEAETDYLPVIEDRKAHASVVPGYSSQSRTERFTPRNLRWRDSGFQ